MLSRTLVLALLGGALALLDAARAPSPALAQSCPLPLSDQRKAVEAFRALMPVFQHPRCANCHGALNVFVPDTKHAGGQMVDPAQKPPTQDLEGLMPGVGPAPLGDDDDGVLQVPHPNRQRAMCAECHDAAGGEWRQEGRGLKQWAGQPAREICQRMKFLDMPGGVPNSPAALLHHFRSDPLILAGFAGRSGGASDRRCPGDPACMTISHESFMAAAQAWMTAIKATDKWMGDEECGCKPPEVEESIVLVVDVSGSMNDNGKIVAAQDAALQVIAEFLGAPGAATPPAGGTTPAPATAAAAAPPPKVEFGILAYSGSCDSTFPFTPFSQDPATLGGVVRGLSAGGGTPMTPALYQARRRIWDEGYGKRGRIVLLTDGQNDCAGSPVEAAERIFKQIEDDVPTQPRQGWLPWPVGGRLAARLDPSGELARLLAPSPAFAAQDPTRRSMPITVSTIGFQVSDAQQAVLDEVAAAGGGTSLRAENATQLAAAFQQALGGGGPVMVGGGGGGGATRRAVPAAAWALLALGLLAAVLAVALVARRSRDLGGGGYEAPAGAPYATAPSGGDASRQPIELTLEIHEPGSAARRVDVRGAPATIGRDGGRDVVLRDPRVSRLHARITVEGGRLWIEDTGSTAGLVVDGRPTRRAELRRGVEIRLGATRLRIL